MSVCGRPKITSTGGSAILVKRGNTVIWRAAVTMDHPQYNYQFPGAGLACGQGETLCISAQAGGVGVVIDISALGHTKVVL